MGVLLPIRLFFAGCGLRVAGCAENSLERFAVSKSEAQKDPDLARAIFTVTQ